MGYGYAKVFLSGRLGRDPEVKCLQSGKNITNFSIAVDDGTKDNKHTSWFRCNAWEKVGDIAVSQGLKSGDQVSIMGRLKERTWEKDGKRNSCVEIDCEMITIGLRKEAGSSRSSNYDGGFDDDTPF